MTLLFVNTYLFRSFLSMSETTKTKNTNYTEVLSHLLFLICAFTSVFALFIIIFFIFSLGVPAILEVGIGNFLMGTVWRPETMQFGIASLLIASVITTIIAFTVGSRLGKWCAIYLAMFCPAKLYRPLKTMVELLGGIPSVVYGFFGVVVIVPFIRNTWGGPGNSLLAATIVLSLMILPTIINISESAIRAVPKVYYEGALALGTTKTEAVFDVVVPAAKSGISASYILGIGRAVGETMAVVMVAGNAPFIPMPLQNIFNSIMGISESPAGGYLQAVGHTAITPVRTLTAGIAMEMGYATGFHRDVLFGIGVVLFTTIISLNIVLSLINRKVD